MSGLLEIGFAIGRIALGLVIQIGGLILLVLIIHLRDITSTRSEQIAAAYDDVYDQGYVQTYEDVYQQTYVEDYDKG